MNLLQSVCDCCGLTYLDVDDCAPDWKTYDEILFDVNLDGVLIHLPVLEAMRDNEWDVICDACVLKLEVGA